MNDQRQSGRPHLLWAAIVAVLYPLSSGPVIALATCITLAAHVFVHPSAFAQDEPNAVFVMQADGGNVRQLTRVEGASDHDFPRWSHDGKRLVFEAGNRDGTARKFYVVNLDGTGQQELGRSAKPDFSPDDKQIVFHEYNANGAEVFVQNADGQGRTRLAAGRSPRWSPDGSKIAMSDKTMLRTLDLVSGEETPLLDAPLEELMSGFDWSPDGKRLAVVGRRGPASPRELLIVSVDAPRMLKARMKTSSGGGISWSPDGKRIALTSNWIIQILEVEGTGPARIVPSQRGRASSPAWSPDGKWIAFVSTRK